MQLSVVLPQQELGFDPDAICDWARRLESLGIDQIDIFDHVLGAEPSHPLLTAPPGMSRAPYTTDHAFHEPLVLAGFLAAATSKIRVATSVLVLPQRQAAVVAKQVAELDFLSGGRFRLGIGIGWNRAELQALDAEFASRGARCEEQVALIRALWSEPVVNFRGRWHNVVGVGLNPLPQRRIPIWMGGMSDSSVRRAARIGDGWVMNANSVTQATRDAVSRFEEALAVLGRPREAVGISGWLKLFGREPQEWLADSIAWAKLGVDCVGLMTNGSGMAIEAHLALVEQYLGVVGRESPLVSS